VFTARHELSKCNCGECSQSHDQAMATSDSRLSLTAEDAFESRPLYLRSVVCVVAV